MREWLAFMLPPPKLASMACMLIGLTLLVLLLSRVFLKLLIAYLLYLPATS